ncbi:MAG: lipid II:glycine glycyltransferase FemX [Actinomycetota bacterium]
MSQLLVRLATPEDRSRFNAFIATSPHGDILQSWEWGEIKHRSGNWSPRRYLATIGDEVVGTMSVLRTVPFKGMPPLLYAPRGPVFKAPEVLQPLVESVKADARRAFMLKVDPPIESGSTEARALQSAGFRKSNSAGFGGVQPRAVMVLDLSPGPEKLFEGFKQKWRYNMRLAERKGVVVSEATTTDLGAFYKVLLETARRDRFFVRGQSYFETLFEVLEPKNMLKMWLARSQDDRVIAGAMCFRFGDRVTYVYGASSNTDRNLMPNHLVQWHMIQWAIAVGANVYDFRGVSPLREGEPTDAHIAGLNRFKEGFGARYVEYIGDLDLPLRPLAWRAWSKGSPYAMSLYKKIKGGAGSAAE